MASVAFSNAVTSPVTSVSHKFGAELTNTENQDPMPIPILFVGH